MIEFLMQGLLFFIILFFILTLISLIKLGLKALHQWNEER